MRWGVQVEAQDQHLAFELCKQEIALCQKSSIGPNFLLFLGQKYGYIGLPSQLQADHFDVVRAILCTSGKEADIEFLEKWFKKDSNAEPSVYILQPISSVLGKCYQKSFLYHNKILQLAKHKLGL